MIEDLIPAGIRQRIFGSSLAPAVLSTSRTLYDHFRLSGLPFFREYTDHSFQHSVDVFKSACDVISEEALDIVSADDLSVLFLCCLFHDAGLHVTEDVFIALTDASNTTITVPEFDQKSWPELWADFLAEAQRFNAKKLIELFGDAQRIREPPRSSIDISQRDRLLIGDFLRRHHPRFAHEFVLGAIPDAKGSRFNFSTIEQPTRDIVGLIARSHGLNLRETFDYVRKHYDLRDYNRIHIVYLMVLIRIADYLQIQSARAPALFGKLHRVRSPFSLGEWKLHQCIENATTSAMDPEAILVSANPKTVHEFLKFEGWMQGLQGEIDKSWAILGEIYGRFTREALNKLQLNIRRVRSNIEDKQQLKERVKFVPEPIRFSVSEPELLRLLMDPLYGENPIYGLRELVQNSADSVNELEHVLLKGARTVGRAKLGADIEIKVFGRPDWSITIADRGTGMTLETIKDYFLKAGASFRNSDKWKKDFTDSTGKSHVARTGRFGVGALSAYLIGDKVKIFTRHYTDKSGKGYSFACSIDDEEIEITEQPGEVGTHIQVQSSEQKIGILNSYLHNRKKRPFFYISERPSISFSTTGEFPATELPRKYGAEKEQAIENALAAPPSWVQVRCSKYETVMWDRTVRTTESKSSREYYLGTEVSGYLYSNGILIGDVLSPRADLVLDDHQYSLLEIAPAPTISIVDHNAYLPVDLARKGLSRSDDELTDAVRRSIYSKLVEEITDGDFNSATELVEWWAESDFPVALGGWTPFILAKNGFCLFDRALLHSLKIKRMFVYRNTAANIGRQLSDPSFVSGDGLVLRRDRNSRGKTGLLRHLQDSYYQSNFPEWESRNETREPALFSDQYLVFDQDVFDQILTLANIPKYAQQLANDGHKFRLGKRELLIVSRYSNVSDASVRELTEFFKRTLDPKMPLFDPVVVWKNYASDGERFSALSQVWSSCFTDTLIPYDKQSRRAGLKREALG